MKKSIHPQLVLSKIKCVCGAVFEIPGTTQGMEIEICKNCSPLFTGTEEKRVVMGQVEKFLRRRQQQKRK